MVKVKQSLEDLARFHPSRVRFSWGQAESKIPLGQAVKALKPAVKFLDPGRKRVTEYSKCGSDLPLLLCISITVSMVVTSPCYCVSPLQ